MSGQSIRSRFLLGIVFAMLPVAASLALGQTRPVESRGPGEPLRLDPPAARGASSPALAVEGPTTVVKEHQILITWLEPSESGKRMRISRLSGDAWNEPITIADPVAPPVPADRPSLTLIDTQAVRRTIIARTGEVIARSGDGGRTWSRLPGHPRPFASFAGGDEGGYVFWLAADGDEPARLLGSRILAGATILAEGVVSGTSTSAAMTWDGPVVVYRDGAEGGQRIAIVRREDAQWTETRAIHAAGWPSGHEWKSGPGVAANRRQVAAAWFTKAGERPRVLAAFSNDAGRTFGSPVEVATEGSGRAPLDFADIALDDRGRAVVLWMASQHGEAMLSLARVAPDGKPGPPLLITKAPRHRLPALPRMAIAGDRVVVAWLEGIPTRLRAVAIPLADIAAGGGDGSAPAVNATRMTKARPGRGRIGESLPTLELLSLDGDKVSLSSLVGRPVLLNLWATWCMPCIKEMPELAEVHDRYQADGLTVVGVSVDAAGAEDKVRRFVSERKLPFAIWLDPEMRLYRALRVRGLPVTLVVDHEGRIVFRQDEAITAGDPEVAQILDRLLD